MHQKNRRRFVRACAAAMGTAAGAAIPVRATHSKLAAADTASPNPAANPIAVFAKHVQGLDYSELGKRTKSIGVQGIEATLRPGGQIEPAELSNNLGRLCDALAESDQRVIIAASNVNQVSAESEEYVKQLAKHDVPYFRMDYYRYDFDRPILPQLEGFARQARSLAELCDSEGVIALYQNHAGQQYVGAAVWDLLQVLSDISPQHLAVALDIRHTTLELSQSYRVAYSAIRPHMGATYIKDFDWIDGEGVNVPLGQGRAKPLFDLIQKDGFVGPLSLHMEYIDHRDPALLEKCWEAITADVATLHGWLRGT